MLQLADTLGDAVRVLPAFCIGRCEQAPAALVGQCAVPRATVPLIEMAVQQVLRQPSGSSDFYKQNSHLALINHAQEAINFESYKAYLAAGGYGLAAAVVNGEEDVQAILQAMEDAGLRGLGGAGFLAGRKWRIVREQPAPRMLAVNLDEGEPGTFKDRTYLERDPHRFLEGMLIAAQVVGTEVCVIYLRDEYHAAREMLMRELEALQADPPCPLPQIELRRDDGTPDGTVFMPFAYREAAANLLTNPVLDPVGKFRSSSTVQWRFRFWGEDISKTCRLISNPVQFNPL